MGQMTLLQLERLGERELSKVTDSPRLVSLCARLRGLKRND